MSEELITSMVKPQHYMTKLITTKYKNLVFVNGDIQLEVIELSKNAPIGPGGSRVVGHISRLLQHGPGQIGRVLRSVFFVSCVLVVLDVQAHSLGLKYGLSHSDLCDDLPNS